MHIDDDLYEFFIVFYNLKSCLAWVYGSINPVTPAVDLLHDLCTDAVSSCFELTVYGPFDWFQMVKSEEDSAINERIRGVHFLLSFLDIGA